MNRAPGRKLRNVGASVRDRLTQRARANADNVQLVLTRYAFEGMFRSRFITAIFVLSFFSRR